MKALRTSVWPLMRMEMATTPRHDKWLTPLDQQQSVPSLMRWDETSRPRGADLKDEYVMDVLEKNPYGGGPSNILYGGLGIPGRGLSAQLACRFCGVKGTGMWVPVKWSRSDYEGVWGWAQEEYGSKVDWECRVCHRQVLVQGGRLT